MTYSGAAAGLPYDGVSPLYGATGGGAHFHGAVFQIKPKGKRSKYQVLYDFCALGDCADGASPTAIFADGSGNLYGTTFAGGGNDGDDFHFGGGTVFKLTGMTLHTLYSFCAQSSCSDGEYPHDSTVMDGEGNLFGTTSQGGAHAGGTLFKISAGGAFSKLHDFCSETDCTDGSDPTNNPLLESDGSLLGAAAGGGPGIGGVIYRYDGSYNALYDFCVGGQGCSDGEAAHSTLVPDGAGNYFGITVGGGAPLSAGTVFELTP